MPTDSIRDAAFCDVLNRELVCALGCTEPIAVAYAAALASQTLGCEPDHMDVACSGNIIKNVKSVTVPNSGGMHGIEAAAVLGAVGGDAKSALEVLESVDDEDRARVTELLADAGYCDVSLVEGVPNLYIKVTATAGGHTAVVEITDHHTNVTCHTLDGIPVCGKSAGSVPPAPSASWPSGRQITPIRPCRLRPSSTLSRTVTLRTPALPLSVRLS